MKGLREKFQNKKGFTLIEMLIVVAIIAILVAVSIPLVNNALDRARQATDAANVRSAKAELMIRYLSEDATQGTIYPYNAATGALGTWAGRGSITAYGKQNSTSANNTNKIIYVVMYNNVVYYQWDTNQGTTIGGDGTISAAPGSGWSTVPNTIEDAK